MAINRICVRMGHQATGEDQAAVGIIKEFDVIREYAPYVIAGFKRLGIEVIDVTPPEGNLSLVDSLNYGINKANELGADYFISLHANDEVETAHGCEVLYQSLAGAKIALSICSELAKLGFYNRGAKPNERGLAELRKTDMVANIIEPLFCSSPIDVDLYKKIGPEKIGYAIVKGVTGLEVPTPQNNNTTEVKEVKKMMDEIIIHDGGQDENAARLLQDYLQCPMIHKDYSSKYVDGFTQIYVVGGTWKPTDTSILISGADRFETMKEVLKFTGKI